MLHVLAILPSYSPSAVINVITPLEELEKRGRIHIAIQLEHEVKPMDVALADAIILSRNVEPIYKPIVDLALELGIPLIYDLDDNLLAPPKGSDAYYYYAHPAHKAYFEWILSNVNLIRVHAPALSEIIQKYNSSVGLRWAAIDWSLVPPKLPLLDSDLIHIVYAAQGETGKKLFNQMQRDLQTLLAHHAKHIRLHFLGYKPPEMCAHPSVICHPFDTTMRRFFVSSRVSAMPSGLRRCWMMNSTTVKPTSNSAITQPQALRAFMRTCHFTIATV